MKAEFTGGECFPQRIGELTAEDFAQHIDRKKELAL